MRAQHADDLLHRFDSRTHRLPTPVIEKLAGPSWGIVVPHPHWNPQESGLRNTGPNCDYLRRRERPRDVGMVWRDSKSWGGFAGVCQLYESQENPDRAEADDDETAMLFVMQSVVANSLC